MKPRGKSNQLFNRYFVLICFAALFTGMCMQMLNSNLAPFANDRWSSKSLGGYLTTIFNAGSILMAFFSGWLVDMKGRKNCFLFACLLFGLPTLACSVWPTPAVTLAVRFIQGLAKGIVTVAAATIVSDVVPRSRMSEGMGLYGLGNTLAMALGPMVALALTRDKNYELMFFVCGLLYLSAGLIGFGIDYEKKPEYAMDIQAKKALSRSVDENHYKGLWKMIERRALPASINYTIFFASTSCILVFITVFSQEVLGYSGSRIGMFYMIAAAVMLLVRMTTGRLADKFGALHVLIPGHLGVIAMHIILITLSRQSYTAYLVAGGLYGFCTATVMPVLNAVAVVDSPKMRNGTANATFAFLMDFGILIGSAAFGPVIDAASSPAAGYRNVFVISILVNLVSLAMAILLFNNRTRSRRLQKAQARDGDVEQVHQGALA